MDAYQPTYDSETRTWQGAIVKGVFNPEASIGQVIFELLNTSYDRLAQIDMDTGRSMMYGEFKTRMIRFAQNLTSIGVQKGDMVTLATAHSENLAPLACALLSIGATLHPLSPFFDADEMVRLMKPIQPKVVFCDANNYNTVRAAVKRAIHGKAPPMYVLEDKRDDVLHAEDLMKETGMEDEFIPHYLGDARTTMAAIVCSSGTSGIRKSVSISHGAVMQLNILWRLLYPRRTPAGRITFTFSPLSWVSGLWMLLNILMHGDVRLFTRNEFNEEQLFEAIEKHRATFIFTTPAYANQALADPRINTVDFRTLDIWLIGGSMVPEDLRDRIDALLPNGRTVNGFGQSESSAVAVDFLGRVPNAVGRLMPGVRIRIVDKNGNRLGIGETGELLTQADFPFLGYFGNAASTEDAIDENGYFRSGDIGYIDEKGNVYLLDRQKDIIENKDGLVAPSELEALVRKIAGVQDVSVVGIPDGTDGTLLPAALIIKHRSSTLDEHTVQSFVDSRVPDFKRLRGGVHFASELPKTDSGKVMRRKVAEIIAERNKRHE